MTTSFINKGIPFPQLFLDKISNTKNNNLFFKLLPILKFTKKKYLHK